MTTHSDWHKADIIAALHKKGTSLAALSREANLAPSTLANALTRPWARGELMIARAIGLVPEQIWPSRYFDANGKQLKRPMRKPLN